MSHELALAFRLMWLFTPFTRTGTSRAWRCRVASIIIQNRPQPVAIAEDRIDRSRQIQEKRLVGFPPLVPKDLNADRFCCLAGGECQASAGGLVVGGFAGAGGCAVGR